jgi:hypothetical protein
VNSGFLDSYFGNRHIPSSGFVKHIGQIFAGLISCGQSGITEFANAVMAISFNL